jgi:uncharacterized delta-60 repeat protein
MKKVISTLTILLLCLYMNAQVGALDGGFNNPDGYVVSNVLPAFPANSDTGFAISAHSNDGRLVVANYTTRENFTLVRYTNLGALDNTFGTSGVVDLRLNAGDNAVPYAVKVLPDNTILVAGWTWGSTKDFCLLKLLEDGTPDLSFGTNGWVVTDFGSGHDEARSMAVQSDGKIVLAGIAFNGNNYDFAVARYTATGSLDLAAFGGGTGKVTTPIAGNDIAKSVAIQSTDQKIVVGGTKDVNGVNPNYMVVRYNTDGSLDATPGNFGTGGIVDLDLGNGGAGSSDVGFSLAIQSDGFIVMTGMSKAVAASNNDVATVRLTTSGGLDPAFNPTGAIVGRIGSFTSPGIALFNNGTAASNTDEGVRSIALQSNGDILVAGDTDGEGATFALMILRYNSNGELDTDFSGDGKAALDLSITADEFGFGMILFSNRIYVAGASGAPSDLLLVALQNDGTPLPLVLSQFYAQKQTSKVVLQWQTTSEEDVKQFVIERSNDGKTYKAIGTVAAVGNSNTKRNYSFADQSPFMSANNYYRLLMQDVDGNFKYSKTLIIKFDGQLSTSMQVFPNPVKDLLQVQLPNGLNGTVGLQIIDMQGRVVK